MIEPDIFLELNDYFDSTQLNFFISVFPLITQIAGKKISADHYWEKEDISQEVAVKMLIWKRNRPQGSYALSEWLKIARTATRHEINDFYRTQKQSPVSLTETEEDFVCQKAQSKHLTTQTEGNTNMELHLLVSQMWEVIKQQSFFENWSLLLQNEELTSYLIGYRACPSREMAERLRLTQREMEAIIEELPLTDRKIAEILSHKFEIKATPAAIRKARQRATDELHTAVYGKKKQPTKSKNERSSGNGKT